MPQAVDAGDDPVDQRHGELELLGGIAARGQRRAHERARPPGREHELGQHRLVELDEVDAGGAQLLELGAQQRDDVLGERLLVRVERARSAPARTSRASAGTDRAA